MTYDAVLLDLYDTLVWSDWYGWQRRLAGVLGISREAMGRAFAETRPARSVGANPDLEGDLAAVLIAAGIDPSPSLMVEVLELEREMATSVRLYDDSLEVVRALREREVPTALVSNCSHNTRPIVDRLGLDKEFDAIVLSFEVGAMKPDAAIYRAALERVGDPDPARAVFVDDQVQYCDGAAAISLQTYLILRPEEALEGRPADLNGHRPIETLRPLLEV
ncbi:MAG: HAD-IA family hydrolase [Actinomycetota bacterium]|nr:HAD-IA family hydrolase [Actinomycetota bacterium]MDH5224256.1 HAD-IA family hydrolase [Actinomycetota bacterium]MDH5312365.1 HAD-IA family hydrolase [Actinomycetota bacterium]